jgi:hypothetical protein
MQPYDPFQQQQPPQQPYQQPFPGQYGHVAPPRRSAIPKVIGILMIIFGGLGLLGGLWSLVVSSAMGSMSSFSGGSDGFSELSTFMTLTKVTNFFGLAISFLELYAGIALVTYKAKGVKLAFTYAIANIAINLITAILVFAWLKPAMDRNGFGGALGLGMLLGTVLSLAWPTVVLALVGRPNAKASCTGF